MSVLIFVLITTLKRLAVVIVAALVVPATARAAVSALRASAPGGRDRWERKNYAGRTVGLYAGSASGTVSVSGLRGGSEHCRRPLDVEDELSMVRTAVGDVRGGCWQRVVHM